MYLFGCLPLLFILALVIIIAIIAKALNMAGNGLLAIKYGSRWLWQSFLNLFRREKQEVVNPFTGESNFDNLHQDADIDFSPTEQHPKRYDDSDGEVTDFTDVQS